MSRLKVTGKRALALLTLPLRGRVHHGNWQPQRNRNIRELLSALVEHILLNGAAQIEETALVY
jgi:hypothetical protein